MKRINLFPRVRSPPYDPNEEQPSSLPPPLRKPKKKILVKNKRKCLRSKVSKTNLSVIPRRKASKRATSLPVIPRSMHDLKTIKKMFTTARRRKICNQSQKISVKVIHSSLSRTKKKVKRKNFETRSR